MCINIRGGKRNTIQEEEEEEEEESGKGVVSRVSSLPLVSSACGVVSSAYSSTKDSVPLLKGVMDVAESGVRTLGAAASTGSKPLLDMLEPQIATVSDYAMMGLDKMEEKLPILQKPADKLMSDTVGMVYQSVSGAKEAMTGAVMGAVMGGMELTKAAVSGGISTVMSTRLGQMASSGMGLAISRSETWPPWPSLRRTRSAPWRPAPATSSVWASSPPSGQERQPGQQGKAEEAEGHAADTTEQLEGRALAMVRGLTDQLQAACAGVVSSAQGLPATVQAQLASARLSAGELRSSLGSSSALTPLLLEQCRHHLTKVQQSMDGVLEYLVHNTPLNWLVGPFSPQLSEKPEGGQMTQK
ncbi:Perilipin-3 [Merluccius polli]|uniref:Perilipin n=1 Tax=Merluccius polli TaxID=89951 RepID=A0AA47PCJ6_MERPO|nr:Perilipin-3 [Merluccius polli]